LGVLLTDLGSSDVARTLADEHDAPDNSLLGGTGRIGVGPGVKKGF
jgi:hypothetical protein